MVNGYEIDRVGGSAKSFKIFRLKAGT